MSLSECAGPSRAESKSHLSFRTSYSTNMSTLGLEQL